MDSQWLRRRGRIGNLTVIVEFKDTDALTSHRRLPVGMSGEILKAVGVLSITVVTLVLIVATLPPSLSLSGPFPGRELVIVGVIALLLLGSGLGPSVDDLLP